MADAHTTQSEKARSCPSQAASRSRTVASSSIVQGIILCLAFLLSFDESIYFSHSFVVQVPTAPRHQATCRPTPGRWTKPSRSSASRLHPTKEYVELPPKPKPRRRQPQRKAPSISQSDGEPDEPAKMTPPPAAASEGGQGENRNNGGNKNRSRNRRNNRKPKQNRPENTSGNDGVEPMDAEVTPDISAGTDVQIGTDSSPYPRFIDLEKDLDPRLIKALTSKEAMGHDRMTEIQAKTFPDGLRGIDVLGRARTGTGKTISFLLPSIQRLLSNQNNRSPNRVQMLVLSPTRELAAQIDEQAAQLLQYVGTNGNRGMTHQVIFGGTSKNKDENAFNRRAPDILTATPGRLNDHLETTRLKNGSWFSELVSEVSILVLDETDRLLDMGFKREVDKIISYLPKSSSRQTLLFSATIPPEVKSVMASCMRKDFVTIDCIHDGGTADDPGAATNRQVDQSHVILDSARHQVTGILDILLKIVHDNASKALKMVVFFPTTNQVALFAALIGDEMDGLLSKSPSGKDVQLFELHSRKSQSYRTSASNKFREVDAETQPSILFTSDVSARGVDYPGVTHVVQCGMADSAESYVHRLGRTGRAGSVGKGLLILADVERKFLNKLPPSAHIPVDTELQQMVDAPTPKFADIIQPLLSTIGRGSNKPLTKNARDGYRSMLGFYNGKLAKLNNQRGDTTELITFCNRFSQQLGLKELPEIELKTARKMGLSNAQGLNFVKVSQSRLDKMNGGGGGRGGGGRGGGGGGRGGRSSSPNPKRFNDGNGGGDGAAPKRQKNGGNRRKGRGGGGGGGRGNSNS